MLRQVGLMDQGTRGRGLHREGAAEIHSGLLSLSRYNTDAPGRSARLGREELLRDCEHMGGFELPTVWEA